MCYISIKLSNYQYKEQWHWSTCWTEQNPSPNGIRRRRWSFNYIPGDLQQAFQGDSTSTLQYPPTNQNKALCPSFWSVPCPIQVPKSQNHNGIVPLLVVKGSQPPLFGRNWNWLSRVKLDWKPICSIRVSGAGLPHDVQIQFTNTIQCHPNVFKPGLGVTRGITAKLEKKPDVEPILASPVLCALQEVVEGECHQL